MFIRGYKKFSPDGTFDEPDSKYFEMGRVTHKWRQLKITVYKNLYLEWN